MPLHLVVDENGIRGHNVQEIECNTKTSINISRYCRDKGVPMIITIESRVGNKSQQRYTSEKIDFEIHATVSCRSQFREEAG